MGSPPLKRGGKPLLPLPKARGIHLLQGCVVEGCSCILCLFTAKTSVDSIRLITHTCHQTQCQILESIRVRRAVNFWLTIVSFNPTTTDFAVVHRVHLSSFILLIPSIKFVLTLVLYVHISVTFCYAR